jgi:hypothetical protein
MILDDIRQWSEQHPDELSMKLFVDTKGAAIPDAEVRTGRIGTKVINQTRSERGLMARASLFEWLRGKTPGIDETKKALFVVCGPES